MEKRSSYNYCCRKEEEEEEEKEEEVAHGQGRLNSRTLSNNPLNVHVPSLNATQVIIGKM